MMTIMANPIVVAFAGWSALAFVFALLPGITALAYMHDCGMRGQDPTFAGYWSMLNQVKKAKKDSYRATANLFSHGGSAWVLAGLFALIVMMCGPVFTFVVVGNAALLLLSFLMFWIVRRKRERYILKEIPDFYVGNRRSRVLHKQDCPECHQAKRVLFVSRREAQEAGYSFCRNCMT